MQATLREGLFVEGPKGARTDMQDNLRDLDVLGAKPFEQ
jgi:hypothetical protein